MRFSPVIKGMITGAGMIAIALITFYAGLPAYSPIQYSIYAVYAIGIVWTLLTYYKSSEFSGKFGDSFAQGFRCFIVVTLLMVLFTGIFSYTHPQFAQESSEYYRQELMKDKNQLPNAIDEAVAKYKKNYTTTLVYGSIIGYLIIGAVVTAVTSLVISRRK